ncbi:amino acid adenylation domain-containing protein [Streptacidiphilus melanogenes]|uniref:amino acid adenylation domain-containing protein n=1 Tax=Streptacidiphilus melanogenes TaxID=411235 RepID=UPI00136488A5|nr:amino acid adenylation domain-containing protein [Streptacidiphilus melanogenes]
MPQRPSPTPRPGRYLLLRNDQEQSGVWPAELAPPDGWRPAGPPSESAHASSAALAAGRPYLWPKLSPGHRSPPGAPTGRAAGRGARGDPVPTVSALVRTQAHRTPLAPALLWAGGQFDYSALDTRADVTAAALQERGCVPGTVAAVCLDRTADLVVCLLAILRTGATLLPLDPAMPPARLAHLLGDARARLVITGEDHRRLCEAAATAGSVDAGRGAATTAVVPVDEVTGVGKPGEGPWERPRPDEPDPDDVAYLIYTSGSTGAPKGIAVTHRSLAGSLAASSAWYGWHPGDRAVHLAAISFDTSLEQIFGPLITGAATVLTGGPPWAPTEVLDAVARHRISTLDLTPAYSRQLLSLLGTGRYALDTLRLVVVGGEIVRAKDCRGWLEHAPGARLVNAYGLTETTITSTTCDLGAWAATADDSAPAPVGRPLRGTLVHVLDPDLRPVPSGERGEVYIGGNHLAEGIWRQPDRTAEEFLPDPLADSPGGRMYRTGDIGVLQPDGTLSVVGRVDDQIKIRGHRIDPAEIEAVLRAHPAVDDVVVVAQQRDQRDQLDQHLAAFYRPAPDAAPDGETADQLRRALARALPGYMMPASFTAVESLPVTPHGKIDRRALARAAHQARSTAGHAPPPARAPATRVPAPAVPEPTVSEPTVLPPAAPAPAAPLRPHAAMAHLWSQILGVGHVREEDDFFHLGGNSLLAMEMLARARVIFGIDITEVRELSRALLHRPTLAAFTEQAMLARRGRLTGADQPPVDFAAEAALNLTAAGTRGPEPNPHRPRDILLTGATGLCGAHMLDELLRRTGARIHCLVRAADQAQAFERLRAAHLRYLRRDLAADRRRDRILPTVGDLAAPRLGLAAETAEALEAELDLIYHFGAQVNFIYPYQDLRAANVNSVRALVELAAPRSVPLHYTSSLAVMAGYGAAGVKQVTESTPLGHADYLSVGYVESKWVAELLLQHAAAVGVPVSVYRLQDVTGSLSTGVLNTATEICALIRFVADSGLCPAVDLPLDLLPADDFAHAVHHISTAVPHAGGVYHLTNPRPALVDVLGDTLRTRGWAVREVPYPEWVGALIRFAAERPAHPVTPFVPLFVDRCNHADMSVSEMYLQSVFPRFSRDHAEAALAGSGLRIPPVDRDMLGRYVDALEGEGYLPPPHRKTSRPATPDGASWPALDLSHAPADAPVAFGGSLAPDDVRAAYAAGAYPMPAPDDRTRETAMASYGAEVRAGRIPVVGAEGDPWAVTWWSPDPRPVIPVDGVHLSRRLARTLNHRLRWTTSADRDFEQVLHACRAGRRPVWLTDELMDCLLELHARGLAHSDEVWEGDQLVGGVLGVRVGRAFSMDTMFGARPGAGAVAVADLARRFAEAGGELLDAQRDSAHVRALGAVLMPRQQYLSLLRGDERSGDLDSVPPLPPWPPLPTAAAEARRLTAR